MYILIITMRKKYIYSPVNLNIPTQVCKYPNTASPYPSPPKKRNPQIFWGEGGGGRETYPLLVLHVLHNLNLEM